ncbi:hypothetical protein HYT45_01165 [Candidatus Uhrbacteria bacterium]|nr:hypothetical protein [Candidatus Uhrbacteria bacterium]
MLKKSFLLFLRLVAAAIVLTPAVFLLFCMGLVVYDLFAYGWQLPPFQYGRTEVVCYGAGAILWIGAGTILLVMSPLILGKLFPSLEGKKEGDK